MANDVDWKALIAEEDERLGLRPVPPTMPLKEQLSEEGLLDVMVDQESFLSRLDLAEDDKKYARCLVAIDHAETLLARFPRQMVTHKASLHVRCDDCASHDDRVGDLIGLGIWVEGRPYFFSYADTERRRIQANLIDDDTIAGPYVCCDAQVSHLPRKGLRQIFPGVGKPRYTLHITHDTAPAFPHPEVPATDDPVPDIPVH